MRNMHAVANQLRHQTFTDLMTEQCNSSGVEVCWNIYMAKTASGQCCRNLL